MDSLAYQIKQETMKLRGNSFEMAIPPPIPLFFIVLFLKWTLVKDLELILDFSWFNKEYDRGRHQVRYICKCNDHPGREGLSGLTTMRPRVGTWAFLFLEGLSLVSVGVSSSPISSRRNSLDGLPTPLVLIKAHQALFLIPRHWEEMCLRYGARDTEHRS